MLGPFKPIIYTCILHITILILLMISIPAAIRPQPETLIFWFIVVLVFFTYLNASLRDPGFLRCYSSMDSNQLFFPEEFPSQESLKVIVAPQTNDTPNISAFMGYVGTCDTKEINFDKESVGAATVSDERGEQVHIQEMEDEDCGPITMNQLDVNANEIALDAQLSQNSSDDDVITITEPCNETVVHSVRPDEPEVVDMDENSQEISVCQNQVDTEFEIETRYWSICNLEIPLRAKHCRECGKWVILHDHHCPWLGTCVGYGNRVHFYWYLCMQTTELLWALVWCSEGFFEVRRYTFEIGLRILVTVLVAFFSLMVTALFIYHNYLAAVNQTTWENISWKKISYLKQWPRSLGSPFSQGFLRNLHIYCIKPNQLWTIPRMSELEVKKHFICC